MDKKEAFITAITDNQALIFKIASVYTSGVEDRNDLAQEITYQLWKSYDGFRQQSSFTTWLYRVAMNTAIYHLKVNKRRVRALPLDERIDIHANENNEEEEKWKILKKHIDNLSLLDKGIIILYMEDKTYEEIAQIIGISASNVGTKLTRIREKLKQQISNH